MADASSQTTSSTTGSGATIIIPDDVRQQHGALTDLIVQSESMNDEERQYWVNILPIMTPEQIENLRTILLNEKQQLAALSVRSSPAPAHQPPLAEVARARREQQEARQANESAARSTDAQAADALLQAMDTL